MEGGGAGPRTLGSERHYFGENFSRTLGWERALGQGPGLDGGRKMEGRGAQQQGRSWAGGWEVRGCDTCGLGLETEVAGAEAAVSAAVELG